MKSFPPQLFILPGLGGSGPDHWQTHWQKSDWRARRVEQRDWQRPRLSDWLKELQGALVSTPGGGILVAHSLACALVAHWVARHPSAGLVQAALLVAPADVDSPLHTPPETRSFAPMPLLRFPFPSTVVASQSDPYVTLDRARHFAAAWGARFIDVGSAGHINSESGLGTWPQGQALLGDLLEGIDPSGQ